MTDNPKTCPKCGSPVAPGLKFCETCGTKIETAPACPKCGAALSPDVRFCETCGAPVSPPDAPAPAAPVAPVPAAATPVAVPEKTPEPPAEPVEKPAPVPEKPSTAPEPPASQKEEPEKPAEKPAAAVPPEKKEEKAAPAPSAEPPRAEKAHAAPTESGGKPSMPQTTMIIAGIVVLAILGAVVFFVVLPMISGPGTSSPPPTTPVTPDTGTPVSSGNAVLDGTVTFTPGPTDVPPAKHALVVDVEKNAISREITVTFQGGEGQYGVREFVVRLSKSDGTVEIKTFKPEYRGTFITMTGTDKEDRVEVTANFYSGETYKVVDKVFEYKKRVGTY